ncbi:MAG: ABC transporter ATP-binding protein/permease [Holosporales bacterium]|nr:ABC transporter ATP-binding protein/permease [Holosporales bacterium]
MLFYIQISSIFLCAILLIICWSYAGVFIRRFTVDSVKSFSRDILNIDTSKIFKNSVSEITDNYLSRLLEIEHSKFNLYGFSIPFLSLFLGIIFLIYLVDIKKLSNLTIAILIDTVTIITCLKIINTLHIKKYKIIIDNFIKRLIPASKGVKYYSSEQFVFEKLDEKIKGILDIMKTSIEKSAWNGFICLALLFCFCLAAYIFKEDYLKIPFDQLDSLLCLTLFIYSIFLTSLMKYFKTNYTQLNLLKPYGIENYDESDHKDLPDNNLFIAFHGVYFQDFFDSKNTSYLNNSTFSILPGEFVTITGENANLSSYIFDLLLKYITPQSGNVYIAGLPINHIKTKTLRNVIGFFKQDFGLIDGTVYDNLRLLTEDHKIILDIAEKLDLYDELEQQVLGGKINQATLFKIQVARISIQQPKILLIESPKYFENTDNEQMFIDFVEYIAQKKTVIIATQYLKFIIYSDKIIYFKKNCEEVCGTHATLAKDLDYQKYIKDLKTTMESY